MAIKFAPVGRRRVIAAGALAPWGWSAPGKAQPKGEKRPDILLPVLRETVGVNKQDETLTPVGRQSVTGRDGKEHVVELAHYAFIGDMHLRFVFDSDRMMLNASPQDLAGLNLTLSTALALAMSNLHRLYGKPVAKRLEGEIMQVAGKSVDFDSSYFLDREFWRGLNRKDPEGLVVAVPKRGSLIYTPLTSTGAVVVLRNAIAGLHKNSGDLRVSSALYHFKDDRWRVFQPPANGGR
jgi:hypothetical protein